MISVINSARNGLPRIDHLREATTAMAFLSIEPLLEDLGEFDLSGIHWVIVGGESGVGARPMQKSWVEHIQQQCKRGKVPFFFKQWGGVRKKVAGRELNGRTFDAMPQVRAVEIPSANERKLLAARYAGVWPPSTPNQSRRSA